mmetsp:Transcript_17113/g.22192  ORF Transcript_17113/g.22192 Transcript_17113/m.22192 type:complete len:100 (-) Transcript_17113:276-575(-)|eukprot:CAMPEP_0197291146 /NCGR_PEP_ID=MMETSP0890-20130614/11702_1 /TAXON_ID=44058 ORGANISM="Aureoumbra lagunensis, Strain CCMP1510" /NCGR_SAMPLE_ID=MMETSP0890 /ASSEMBLY_ACC=CAM_ASM_000533 /LENGTH=99 /DNA_ID=CAMNT_0042763751 /DNA_START=64 /DNA_END=363 /DNA_ORIENTATION=-
MLRKLITFAILALTAAFAPSAQVARSQFTVRPSAPTRTIAEEVEVLVSKSLKKAEMRLEATAKDLTRDIDANAKNAKDEMLASRLDKIEDMLMEIAKKI